MATYMSEHINISPTRTFEVGESITGPFVAIKLNDDGKAVMASAGEAAVALTLGATDVPQDTGDVHTQISGVGYWYAGADIAAGDLLAADADGKAVKATAGAFIIGQALETATAGGVVNVHITKSGYAK